ncbi:MAG: GAF domain-containing protein [Pirellulaceae bacterium]
MNPIQPSYLRLHIEEEETEVADPVSTLPGLSALMDSFASSTGWKLSFQETSSSYDARRVDSQASHLPARGKLVIEDMCEQWPAGKATAHRQRCDSLVDSLNFMLEQLTVTREALWRREAELATSVPVITRGDDTQHVAKRLETSLQAACNGVGAQAAALYVLDDATSQLKMRACWGLPQHRLLEPARPLQGALADLEALLGHAIVLEDCSTTGHWESPEPAESAVCVPVSSATTPLGTLWVFGGEKRDYSSQETNLIEIVAGRIAAELEREAAVAVGRNASTHEASSRTLGSGSNRDSAISRRWSMISMWPASPSSPTRWAVISIGGACRTMDGWP